MSKIPHTNTSDAPAYVAGVLLRPGETRLVDARLLPASPEYASPSPAAPAPTSPAPDPLLDILDGPVREIAAGLAALSDAELTTLEAAERAGKTRKGVIDAIATERAARAAG
jgi:hypothetical protein